ncbi:MAG: tetratricopeptide repeat protein [Opitutales bacterium]
MKQRKVYFGAILLTGLAFALGLAIHAVEESARQKILKPKVIAIEARTGQEPDDEAEDATPLEVTEATDSPRSGPKPAASEDPEQEAAVRAAIEKVAEDEYKEAIADLEKLNEQYPNDARIDYHLGLSLSKLNQEAEAIKAYERAIELFPNYQSALFNAGILHRRAEDYQDAISAFTRVIEVGEPSIQAKAYAMRAHCFRSQEIYLAAIADYKRSLELRPESVSTRRFLALSYSKTPSTWEDAYRELNRCLELQADYRIGLRMRAGLLWERGDLEAALKDYAALHNLEFPRQNRYWEMALIEWQLERPVRAKQQFRKLLNKLKSSQDKRIIRAFIQFIEGNIEGARATLDDVDPSKANSYKLNYLAGHLDFAQEDFSAAKNKFELIQLEAESDPTVALALTEIAILETDEQAGGRTLRHIEANPKLARSWQLRTQYLVDTSDTEATLDAFQQLRSLRPQVDVYENAIQWMLENTLIQESSQWLAAAENAGITSNTLSRLRARHLSKTGAHTTAISQLTALIAQHPRDGYLAAELSDVYATQQQFESAIEAIDQAIKALPAESRFRYQRAMLLKKVGNIEEALEEARRILALDSKNAEALAFIDSTHP